MTGPLGNRLRRAVAPRISDRRNKVSRRVRDTLPSLGDRNMGEGVVVGAAGAAVATVLEETVGIPFGASVDVIDVQPEGEYNIYTVDVNAPTENMAEARAFLDSTTGFVSYLTDKYEIQDAEVITSRLARDTYRVQVRVEAIR